MLPLLVVTPILVCISHFAIPVQSAETKITWGMNPGSVESENVKHDCRYMGRSICCSTFRGIPSEERKYIVANSTRGVDGLRRRPCVITRTYIPSPYETRHIEFAASLAKMSDKDADKALVDFLVSDVEMDAANIWLARVKYRMTNKGQYTEVSNDDDFKYMSRFSISKRCPHSRQDADWDEWIEPLTVHARYPYGVGCGRSDIFDIQKKKSNYPGPRGIIHVDHILTLSGDAFSNHTNSRSLVHNGQRYGGVTKRMFFDAGTSIFDSSLKWFTCAYSQNKMYMDVMYGWEMTLLEPTSFWDGVPDEISQLYHFYNVPISSNITAKSNPLRIIKDIATLDDFVSFKLDIDTPSVEIPLALQILANPGIAELIDEFFFELHFNCPLMKGCWGVQPDTVAGLKMDRISAMNLFQKYRQLGIRSHFWP